MYGGATNQFQINGGIATNGTSQAHISSIANVFYNMLNLLGEKEKDPRVIGLANSIKDTM
jgi:hypothetical protein